MPPKTGNTGQNTVNQSKDIANFIKKYGTLPFAGIARCAFISKSILDSLNLLGMVTGKDLENFYKSIYTVSKHLNHDYYKAKRNNSFKNFLI